MKKMRLTSIGSIVIAAGLAAALTACGSGSAGSTAGGMSTSATGSTNSTGSADAGSSYTGEVRQILAATSGSPRPFTYYDDNNELTGQNIEILNAVFDRLPQYELSWEVTEFPSMFTGMDAGRYQVVANNISSNAERREKYLFSDSMLKNSLVVIANKNSDLPDDSVTYDDLAGLTYIGSPNITYTTAIENWNDANPDKQINIKYSEEDLSRQIQGIQDGSADYDFLTIDQPMFDGYYQPTFNFDVKEITLNSDADSDLDSYFVFPKGEEQLRDDVNTALHEIVADGTVKAIDEKYLGGDFSPVYDD